MSIKIEKKITRYAVQKPEEAAAKTAPVSTEKADVKAAALAVSSRPVEKIIAEKRPKAEVIRMHEKLERPDMLIGSTYKVKTPVSDHAMYITINDILLNEGTPYEQRRPFEIFINSKNLDHFQWIVALTRIISAVFRKGGDVTFLVEELKAVFDPRGGAWMGGHYVPSLLAAIGDVIERHMTAIGFMTPKAAPKEIGLERQVVNLSGTNPPRMAQCPKCGQAALIRLENCDQCTNCDYSKCG